MQLVLTVNGGFLNVVSTVLSAICSLLTFVAPMLFNLVMTFLKKITLLVLAFFACHHIASNINLIFLTFYFGFTCLFYMFIHCSVEHIAALSEFH